MTSPQRLRTDADMLSNKYGHFSADGKAFTITDPATPTPWTNVVCNGRFGFIVSQNGGGFSWFDNSQLNVLTRWDMDLVRDQCGKFLYLADLNDDRDADGDARRVWSLAPTPCRPEYDSYTCDHGIGFTTFTTVCNGVKAVWTMAVAAEDQAELWHVELTNLEARSRKLRISSYFDWCCGVAPDVKREFHRLFFTTSHEPAKDGSRNAIFAIKNMWDVPPRSEAEHWNRPWPYVAAHSVAGLKFDAPIALADKTAFLGRYADPARPVAMMGSTPGAGIFGRFGDAAAALGGDFTIPAKGTVTLHYVMAIGESKAQTESIIEKFTPKEAVSKAIAAAKNAWESRLSSTAVKTALPDFDVMNNRWLPYQAISARLWGRTGYYQQSGAFGFRDQLQDSQVWLTLDPIKCREQIRLHARHQFMDGSVYHWWHPLAEFGNHTACSDDYLWLPFIIAAYIKETGDTAVLNFREPFVDSKDETTLLDHCERSIARAFARMSPRGLPLIGSCDWNDGLSAMGVEGKGESVWLAMFLCSILEDFAGIYSRVEGSHGNAAKVADCKAKRQKLAEAVNALAWDGSHFRYGTRDDGQWVGSSGNTEGKIHLNAQTWAILSDCTTPDRAATAWKSVKENLLTDFGPLLLAPGYTVPDLKIGYITRYAPGTRENGGVYMHAATWCLAAAAKMGDVESVARIWKSVSPPTRGADADAYRAEPYVVPGNVDGPLSDLPGRAGWTWYTGSAQWLRKVSMDWVLGVRATFAGLLIEPCTPAEFGAVEVTRLYRGCSVRVKFDARQSVPAAKPRLTLDGVVLESNVIDPTMLAGKVSATVEVSWPSSTASSAVIATNGAVSGVEPKVGIRDAGKIVSSSAGSSAGRSGR